MNSSQQISDYIFFYPDAIDTETCNLIIDNYEADAEWKDSTFANAYENTGKSKVSMKERWIGEHRKYHKELKEAFNYCVNDYISVHDKIKILEYTDFRINRYEANGFMKQHIDAIHHSHGQKQGYPHLTSLIFLNDDYEGGEFVLCGDKYIEKIQGSAVVFPSNFMFPHEVKKVISGNRYSVMTWVM